MKNLKLLILLQLVFLLSLISCTDDINNAENNKIINGISYLKSHYSKCEVSFEHIPYECRYSEYDTSGLGVECYSLDTLNYSYEFDINNIILINNESLIFNINKEKSDSIDNQYFKINTTLSFKLDINNLNLDSLKILENKEFNYPIVPYGTEDTYNRNSIFQIDMNNLRFNIYSDSSIIATCSGNQLNDKYTNFIYGYNEKNLVSLVICTNYGRTLLPYINSKVSIKLW